MDAKVSCAPAGTGSACYIETGSGAALFAAPGPAFCFFVLLFRR